MHRRPELFSFTSTVILGSIGLIFILMQCGLCSCRKLDHCRRLAFSQSVLRVQCQAVCTTYFTNRIILPESSVLRISLDLESTVETGSQSQVNLTLKGISIEHQRLQNSTNASDAFLCSLQPESLCLLAVAELTEMTFHNLQPVGYAACAQDNTTFDNGCHVNLFPTVDWLDDEDVFSDSLHAVLRQIIYGWEWSRFGGFALDAMSIRRPDRNALETLKLLPESLLVGKLRIDQGQFGSEPVRLPYIALGQLVHLHVVNSQLVDIDLAGLIGVANLEYLDLRGNKLYAVPKIARSLSRLTTLDISDNMPEGRLDLSTFPYEINSLRNFFLCGTPIGVLPHAAFANMPNLEKLLLRNCSISDLGFWPFQNLTRLQILDLSHNTIPLAKPWLKSTIFQGLKQLRELRLKSNEIRFYEPLPFLSNMWNLEIVDLSENNLTTLYSLMFEDVSIQTLDLESNEISLWTQHVFTLEANISYLVLTGNKVSRVTEAMRDDFLRVDKVELQDNPFDCSYCHLRYLKEVIASNKTAEAHRYHCSSPPELRRTAVLNAKYSLDGCQPLSAAVTWGISVASCALLCAAASLTCYHYRWHVRVLILKHRYWVRRTRDAADASTYTYDAFVSYAASEREWVMHDLLQRLEVEKDMKMCVHERDFLGGSDITENILEGFRKSYRVVFVLSDTFVRSHWCMQELYMACCEMAEKQRDALILILMEEISMNIVPKKLRYLMETKTYLRWTDDPGRQYLFWENLILAMKRPVST